MKFHPTNFKGRRVQERRKCYRAKYWAKYWGPLTLFPIPCPDIHWIGQPGFLAGWTGDLVYVTWERNLFPHKPLPDSSLLSLLEHARPRCLAFFKTKQLYLEKDMTLLQKYNPIDTLPSTWSNSIILGPSLFYLLHVQLTLSSECQLQLRLQTSIQCVPVPRPVLFLPPPSIARCIVHDRTLKCTQWNAHDGLRTMEIAE